jgi:glucose/arabinose dehydrogenase
MRAWFLSLTIIAVSLGGLVARDAARFQHPVAVVIAADGRPFVAHAAGLAPLEAPATTFAAVPNPVQVVAWQKWLFVADAQQIWRVDAAGKAEVFVSASAFPTPAPQLVGLAVEPGKGTLFALGIQPERNALFRIEQPGKVVGVVTIRSDRAPLPRLTGLGWEGDGYVLGADRSIGAVVRVRVQDGTIETIAEGIAGATGATFDYFGRLWVSAGARVVVVPRPGLAPVAVPTPFQTAGTPRLDATGANVLVPDTQAGTVMRIPTQVPGQPVETAPLVVRLAPAFPKLQWTGWEPETAAGKPNSHRPLVLTHANDGSGRTFVATQQGVIHLVTPNAAASTVFLDLQDRVAYNDNQNEEGFLGLAFHPQYKTTGEFFVFYTPKKEKATNIVARFRVRADNPNQADPASEREVIRFSKPYWNHDGGTIAFGPDGYLYVTHGDGGAANDPFDNAQNLKSLLGKVLRLDINSKDAPYTIPADNPFVNVKDARPEIWAYGLRNVWRMAFDRQTGQLWAADVGQNWYEEINLIRKGGNYGWKRREATHPFGMDGANPNDKHIDPIWEYHHDLGKSITGGTVYRGSATPALRGAYVYADYVTGRLWALRYDEKLQRVTANQPIPDQKWPIVSFGEDEAGEIYLLTVTRDGSGIHTLRPAE